MTAAHEHDRQRRASHVHSISARVEAAVLRNGQPGCTTAWLSDTTGLSISRTWHYIRELSARGRVVATNMGGEGNRWLHRWHANRVPPEELMEPTVWQ